MKSEIRERYGLKPIGAVQRLAVVNPEVAALLAQLQKPSKFHLPFTLDGKKYRIAKAYSNHSYWIDCETARQDVCDLTRAKAYLGQRDGKLILALRTARDILWFHGIGWAVQLNWGLYVLREAITTEPELEALPLYSPQTTKRLGLAVRDWQEEKEEGLDG